MARKAYIGIPTEISNYDTQIITTNITVSNISEYFTVTNGTYYFKGSGNTFTSNNTSTSKTATTTLTALFDMDISFDYSVSGRANFTAQVAGNTIVAASSTTDPGTYYGSISAGQSIIFTNTLSSSFGSNSSAFSNITVTTETKELINTETKEVARKIKNCYIGIPTNVPVYGEPVNTTIAINNENLSKYFSQYSSLSSSLSFSDNSFIYLNNSTAATLTFTALVDCSNISFDYEVSSLSSSLLNGTPSLTLKINEVSQGTLSKENSKVSYSGALAAGDTITFILTSTSSQLGKYQAKISNFQITSIIAPQTGVALKDIAHKIKKAYIGIGNVARLCFSKAPFDYCGTITPVGNRAFMGATALGDFILFAGGLSSYVSGGYIYYTCTSNVYAYDKHLVQTSIDPLNSARARMGSNTIGNYAIFGGGTTGSSDGLSDVDAYDSSLTKLINVPALSYSARMISTAKAKNKYLIFAGGASSWEGAGVSGTTCYNTSLTKISIGTLLEPTVDAGAASVGEYALFANGTTSDGVNPGDYALAFNLQLTQIKIADSSWVRCPGSATVKNMAIFQQRGASYIGYDDTLTKRTFVGPVSADYSCGITTPNLAVFAGANDFKNITLIDSQLTSFNASHQLSVQRGGASGAYNNDYVLIAGGYYNNGESSGSNTYYNTVDVFMVNN